MWNLLFLDTDLYHFLSWFFLYSIIGWCVESVYMSVCNKKLTNRGFIHGPICPIYGIGALGVYYILKPFAENYMVLYLLGAMLATLLELLTARLTSKLFGMVWWDYTNKPFHYKGIICLESTIAWGFYTVFLFRFLQKGVEFIVNAYSPIFGEKLLTVIFVYFIIDLSLCLHRAVKGEVESNENNSLAA